MSVIIVPASIGAAVACAPVLARWLGRLAGWPLGIVFLVVAGLLVRMFDGTALEFSSPWVPGMELALRADGLGVFFALLALVIGAVVFFYSAAYLPRQKGAVSFYTIMTAFTASIVLLVLADDVVVLFIAWELVSLASFMLIARSGGKGGEQGSQRTLILTFIGGLTLLAAVVIATAQAGTTRLSVILASDFWADRPTLTATVAVLVAVSAFSKSAQLPFHFWLPEAMAAATPVSAFLHAAAVVKAGIYLLLRFSAVFATVPVWNYLLIITGMTTAVMAALFAVQKTDLKKLTAYSTVSHLGWIVATIGVGTPVALAAALVHTLAHALFKSSLFMLIGVVDHQTGTREMTRLGSSWRQLPLTFTAVIIACASMAALPPTFGFVSKEGMLAAFEEAPLGGVGVVLLLIAGAVGALLTLTYSTRIIADGFIDGDRDMSEVKEAKLALLLPATLPGLVSLPLVFWLGRLDGPLGVATAAAAHHDPHLHLGLWHGVTVPLVISLGVLAVGAVGVVYRARVWALLDGKALAPRSGNDLLKDVLQATSKVGRVFAAMADSLSPARHLAFMFTLVVGYAGAVTVQSLRTGTVDGVPLAPRLPTDRATDLVMLAIVVAGVWGLLRTRKRLSAIVFVSVVGVGVTLQILTLGAPDVALTQFLVEALVVVIMMLIVRQQPDRFHPVTPSRQVLGAILGVAVGAVTFMGVWFLLARPATGQRSELALWYLEEAPGITGGDNVVNTILVEFRALDTLGELSVLGMAAIVIAAVVSSMPRYPFYKGAHPAPIGESVLNSIPLRTLVRILVPVLVVLSVLVFWRGHNSPGGGFIAALIAGCAFMLSYLSFPRDEKIVATKVPVYLTGAGIATAVAAGFLGLLKGSFLYAIHGEFLHQHWTTSMIFDVGVYLAVLGMVTMALNALGGYLRPGMENNQLTFTADEGATVPHTLEDLSLIDPPAHLEEKK